jgi:hypothetical protein
MPSAYDQSLIDRYDALYGPGNAVSASILASPSEQGQMPTMPDYEPRERVIMPEVTSELDVLRQAASTEDVRELEIAHAGDVEGAREQAREEVQGVLSASRDATGNVVHGQRVHELADRNPVMALLLSTLPQTIEMGDSLSASQRDELQTLRNNVVRSSQSAAMRLADEQEIPLSERAEFIQEKSRLGMGRHLNEIWQQLYLTTRAEELTNRGYSAETVLPPAENGEIRRAASARASSMFDSIVAHAFADDQDIQLPSGETLFESARDVAESRPLLMAAERTRRGEETLVDQTRQYLHGWVRDRDESSGEVTETAAGAAVRDTGLATSWILDSFFQAATWERDPSTGLPLDPNDLNYRLSAYMDRLTAELEGGQNIGAWERNIFRYVNFVTAAFRGAENVADSTMSTGNGLTDLAISHAQGEWEGSNIANIHALQILQENLGGYWDWHDDIFGLASAVAVPAGALTGVVSPVATAGLDSLSAIAKGASASRVGEGLANLSLMANSTESWGQVRKLIAFGRDAVEELGGNVKALVGRTEDGAELMGDRITRKLTDRLAHGVLSAESANDLKRVFPDVKQGQALDNVVQESFSALQRLRQAGVRGLSSLVGDDVGQRVLHHVNRVVKEGSSIPPASQARVVMYNLIKEKVAPIVQREVPNKWVTIGNSPVIVRVGAWLNHRDEITGLLKPLLKADLTDAGGAVYKNGREAADYLVSALKGDEYHPLWRKTIQSMRQGKSIPTAMYARANDLIRGAVAKSIIKTGVEASDFSAPFAKELAAGRSLTKVDAFKDFYRGMRALRGGKSDYSWVADAAKDAKGQRFRPDPMAFVKKSPPVFRKWTKETMNRLAEAPQEANRLLRVAQLDPANKGLTREAILEKVFREMSTGNVVDDYKEILDIFYSSKSAKLFGEVAGDLGLLSSKKFPKEELARILATGGDRVTMSGVRRVISELSDSVAGSLSSKLEGMAIKKRGEFSFRPSKWWANRKWLRLTDADDLDQLMSGWAIYRMKERVWAKAMKELEEVMPNLMMRVPEKAAKLGRLKMLNQALVANGVPASLHQQISNIANKMLSTADSERRVMVNALVGDMFSKGGLSTGDDLSRITDAVSDTVVVAQGIERGGSFENIRQLLTQATKLDPSLGTADELMRLIFPAVIKATTDLDMNIIRSRFSAFGVESSAARRAPSKTTQGYEFKEFGEIGRLLYDKQMEDILVRLQQPGQIQKLQREFDTLRPAERTGADWFRDMLQITKRSTVTGLLGGFPLPGTRFMGNNLAGHWLIAAVTAPKYLMEVMMNTGTALTQSFVRAAKRSGWWASDDVYDFNHARYVAKPDEVLFNTVDGEMWTKRMFDDAMDRNNLRFTQISHEFQGAVFEDWVRTSKMGPNGRSILDYTKVPWEEGTIAQDRFWAFLDPSKKNIWSMMGEEADVIQREAVFRAALKNGLGEDVAANLARNSMLDYGSIDKSDQAFTLAKKYIPFFAFRYNMFMETARAFVRNGESLQNIARVGKMVNAQRESMEDWVLQPDYAKNRLFNTLGKDFREWHTINVGIQIPWMEHYVAMFNVAEAAMRLVVGNLAGQEETVGRLGVAEPKALAQTVIEAFISDPRLGPILEIINTQPDSMAPHGYMPSPILEAMAARGMLDAFVGWFGLEAIPQSQQRPDLPTFDGEQYRIPDGVQALKWYSLNELLLITGLERNIRDYIRLAIKAGLVPEGVEARRDGEGNLWMYGIGGTQYSFPSRWLAEQNAREAAIIRLRDMSRQPTTSE